MICDASPLFLDAATLKSHLNKKHAGAVSDLEVFADACETIAFPSLMSCPLCDWEGGEAEAVDSDKLIEHVTDHLLSFSLRSLPWAEEIDFERCETERGVDGYIDGLMPQLG